MHVLELLDHFEHHGPNGTHLCLVLPVMISDGAGMTVTMTSHSADYVRAISKQILFGLDFLHRLGIIHCDLQPANIRFSLAGVNELDLDPPEFSPVRWLEGVQADDSAPEYLIPSQRRRGQLDGADPHTLFVKIGDLGGAVWSSQHDQWPVTPRALRPPELICRDTWEANIDLWTLGCTIFELATNEPLFPIGTFGLSAEQIDREHSRLIEQIFGNDGQTNERFTKHVEDRLPPDFGIKNIQRLSWLLLSMLQISPEKRMSAAQLLDHIFLEGVPES
ncbi:hypothetical protein Plec18167_008615 [Paecilomyces lecythidis]|uniref:Protein kinase domain-containing protein n=1 Tax=Paecilomyces lecythidis TaxID=3004212 RepID=A0ABR3WW47_9EURO